MDRIVLFVILICAALLVGGAACNLVAKLNSDTLVEALR